MMHQPFHSSSTHQLRPSRQALDRRTDLIWCTALFLAALGLYTLNLDSLALRDWDEATVAQVAREIAQGRFLPQLDTPIESLRWLFPTLDGQPYWNKPPLLHTLIALCFRVWGEHEWTARLPGALLSAATVPLLFVTVRELWQRRLEAIFSSLVLLTWLPVVRLGRLAMLDGAIVCFFVLAINFVLRSRRDLRYALGFGGAIALMCLTKGLLGVCLGGLLLIFLAWDTPRLLWQPWFWYGVGLGSFPAVIWYALQIQQYGSEFFGVHFGTQAINRLWSVVEANQGAPWYVAYYAIELLKYGFPWLLFAAAGMGWAWQQRQFGWGRLLLVCGGGYFALISLMQTKLPWYVLPLYPILAIAAGVRLAPLWRWLNPYSSTDPQAKFPRFWWLFLLTLAIGVGTAIGIDLRLPTPTFTPQTYLTLFCLLCTLGLASWRMQAQDSQCLIVLIWGMYLTLLTFVTSDGWLWELNEAYPVRSVAMLVKQYLPPDRPIVVVDTVNRPSLNYYAGRAIETLDSETFARRWQAEANLCVLAAPELHQALPSNFFPHSAPSIAAPVPPSDHLAARLIAEVPNHPENLAAGWQLWCRDR